MKKFFVMLIMCLSLSCIIKTEPASAKSNLQIVKQLCKSLKKPIKFVPINSKKILHRKNKNYIVVEKVVSYSSGKKYGYTKEGYYIAYNKKVPKNKKIVSYFIYNPKTNYFDDILWAIDNNTYR